MYAVIRAGGKQYRVAPGDVIRVEKTAPGGDGRVEFDVLAVSAGEGQIGRPQGAARAVGQVLGEGRGDKILVFHYKRKKQYKKIAGHRQPFTAVKITEIAFDGQKFTAPAEAAKPKVEKKAKPAAEVPAPAHHEAKEHAPKKTAHAKEEAHAKSAHAKPAAKKSAHARPQGKKKK